MATTAAPETGGSKCAAPAAKAATAVAGKSMIRNRPKSPSRIKYPEAYRETGAYVGTALGPERHPAARVSGGLRIIEGQAQEWIPALPRAIATLQPTR